MKLFVIYIGGKMETSLIELHDMRFVVAERIEDTFQDLKQEWWGVPKSLHIDCWGVLSYADGYRISLEKKPSKSSKKLFFVNLGGYDANIFTELHENIFVVAENESDAKVRALQQIKNTVNWGSPHRDYLYDVENCFCLNYIAEEKSHFIHLTETEVSIPFAFTCKYIPIEHKTKVLS